jgi:glucan phosphoethanolaminetransferase (alkaline phosphatase superfamily)
VLTVLKSESLIFLELSGPVHGLFYLFTATTNTESANTNNTNINNTATGNAISIGFVVVLVMVVVVEVVLVVLVLVIVRTEDMIVEEAVVSRVVIAVVLVACQPRFFIVHVRRHNERLHTMRPNRPRPKCRVTSALPMFTAEKLRSVERKIAKEYFIILRYRGLLSQDQSEATTKTNVIQNIAVL